jgi:hypothetical protein
MLSVSNQNHRLQDKLRAPSENRKFSNVKLSFPMGKTAEKTVCVIK